MEKIPPKIIDEKAPAPAPGEREHGHEHENEEEGGNIADDIQLEKALALNDETALVENAELDRRLNRKFDLHILPWLFGIWYFLSSFLSFLFIFFFLFFFLWGERGFCCW